jgi:hypothetical protein
MPDAFTPTQMQARLDQVTAEVDAMTAAHKPLHDRYNELHNLMVPMIAEQQDIKNKLRTEEAPLIALRQEQSVLARALGGKRLENTPA